MKLEKKAMTGRTYLELKMIDKWGWLEILRDLITDFWPGIVERECCKTAFVDRWGREN